MSSTTTNPQALSTTAPTLSSTSSSTYSSYIELENQLILRMPYKKEPNGMVRLHSATATLREILEKINSGEVIDQDPLKDRLFVQLDPETRKGRVKFDDEVFEARLVDLPCIIESHKTLDKKAFFKTADISQMLVCKTQDDPWTLSDEELFNEHNKQLRKLGKLKKKYQWPHGITPPLKNVRKKRFRKLNRKKTLDYDDIEKELRELFKQDREAIRTEYEVIYLDRDPDEIEEEDDDDDDFTQQGRKRASRPSYHLHPITEFEDKDGSSRPDSVSNTNSRAAMPARRSSRVTSRGDGSNLSASDTTGILPEKASSKQPANLNMTQEETSEKRERLETSEDSTMDTKKSETGQDATKARTNFKNLFVKDVIGDLSSSDESDEGDEEDEDDDDYDDNSKSKGPRTSKTVGKAQRSKFFTHDEDSVSNFDRSTRNYDDDDDEEDEEEDDNSRVANKTKELTTKSLFGESDENDSDAPETEDEEEEEIDTFDEEDDEKTRGSEISKTRTDQATANLNLAYDLSLSSSDHNNTEMEASQQQTEDPLAETLNKLLSELSKIQEDRKKREIDVQAINNPVLKARLSSTLNNLIEEENRKLEEIDQVKSLMNK